MASRVARLTDADLYREHGYTALPGLFPPAVVEAFYRQLRTDMGIGTNATVKYLRPNRLMDKLALDIHSDQYPSMAAFLWGLTPRIALATQCDLLPTYAFFRLYQKGDICRIHADRPACEHSLSLTLASGGDMRWALSVATSDSNHVRVSDDFGGESYGSVAMHPGDATLYRGVDRRHGRLQPNPNPWSAHLFLHWVDAAGPYRDHAFDCLSAGATDVAAVS